MFPLFLTVKHITQCFLIVSEIPSRTEHYMQGYYRKWVKENYMKRLQNDEFQLGMKKGLTVTAILKAAVGFS